MDAADISCTGKGRLSFAATKWESQGTILITGGTGASIVPFPLARGPWRAAPYPDVAAWRTCAWIGGPGGGASGKGCRADVRACDVGDGVAVDALIRDLWQSTEGTRSPLRHIFHLAGVGCGRSAEGVDPRRRLSESRVARLAARGHCVQRYDAARSESWIHSFSMDRCLGC